MAYIFIGSGRSPHNLRQITVPRMHVHICTFMRSQFASSQMCTQLKNLIMYEPLFSRINKHVSVMYTLIIFQSDDAVNPDRLYDLIAVVIHCGSGPNRGHYISIVKSHGFWLLFDDDQVDVSTLYYLFYCIQFIYYQLKPHSCHHICKNWILQVIFKIGLQT